MRLTASGERTYEHEILDRLPRTDPALYPNGRGVAVGIMTGSESTFAVYHRPASRFCIVQPDMPGFRCGSRDRCGEKPVLNAIKSILDD
jgi:hypothetical protein